MLLARVLSLFIAEENGSGSNMQHAKEESGLQVQLELMRRE